MKSLKYQLFDALNIDKDKQTTKLTEAPQIKNKEKGKFMVVKKFAVVQADVIYMKEDPKGYKYIMTVVDVATRAMDAEPMIGRTADDAIEAFDRIFKRKRITTEIETLYTDPGSEFANKKFHEHMNTYGIEVRHTKTARKGQMGVVEYFNHLITKSLYTKMTTVELETKKDFSEWSDLLPKVVTILNEAGNLKKPKTTQFFKDIRATNKEIDERLEVGEVVHVRLETPVDHLLDKNNKLHGTFRNGDIRWEQSLTEITNVIMVPNQPIRYMVKKYNNATFLRKELLIASPEDKTKYRNENPKQPEKIKETQKLPEKGPITRSMRQKANQTLP